MTNKKEYGQKIDIAKAEKLIQKHTEITDKARVQIKAHFETLKAEDGTLEFADALKYYSKEYNAFIFTKELVMRFFNGDPDDKHAPKQSADYLMVILGAQTEDDKDKKFLKGEPTVLVAGVYKKEEESEDFYSLGIPEAADEHPPHITIAEFPNQFNDAEKVFKFSLK